jgi:hypothetical protein
MRKLTNQQVISSIQNGDESILFYLSRKYFEQVRKLLRRKGCRDQDTPAIFAGILLNVYREIQTNRLSPNVDFENFLMNSVKEHINDFKLLSFQNDHLLPADKEIVSSCFSILDESSRKVLAARYCENLSFEQIAARLGYSNPVIAHFEFNKAFTVFENIVRARLNVQSN